MKFRFGLRTLLFIPVVFAAALGWWVTWPQRTASRFVYLMATDPDRAEEMSPASGMWQAMRTNDHGRPYLNPLSRSMADILLGKQAFTVILPVADMHRDGVPTDLTGTLLFERGKLRGPIELDSRPKRIAL